MVTIRVELWDAKGFLKFRMDITEQFIWVARAVNAAWKSVVPLGHCVGLRGPDGCIFSLTDTPDSLAVEDGAKMPTCLEKTVRSNYQAELEEVCGIHSSPRHAVCVQFRQTYDVATHCDPKVLMEQSSD